MPQQARQPSYLQAPEHYSNQPPYSPGYSVDWQHTDSAAKQNGRWNGQGASRGAMVPSSRTFTDKIVQSRTKQMSEQYHYQQYGQPPPQVEDQTVPVLLCHTCSVCRRMRSAGYHRHNPVVPGKPLVLTPCRRCKKRIQSQQRSMRSYTRTRSCTADEPCDWPREPVSIDLDRNERRGRRQSREEVYVYRHSPSHPHVVRQSSSQTKFGLRVLQDRSPPHVRASSLSPRRGSRYDEVWPPPDVVRMEASKSDDVHPAVWSHSNSTSRNEVWPPPDVIHTHSHRKAPTSPLRRSSSRIIELSPSPPPARTPSRRVTYRSNPLERHSRSISPVRASFRSEAEARMMSHPRPYRPVLPDHRRFTTASDETSSNNDYMHRTRQESPNRSILKPPGGERETSHRRMNMRESQQSITVEVGGPRVHFGSERRADRLAPANSDKRRHAGDTQRSSEEHRHYHDYSRHRYINGSPRIAPVDEMERLRIRQSPPSPQQSYEEETRIGRARRISPSPPRRYKEIHTRHVSPLPLREGERRICPPPPASLSPERLPHSGYRHVSRIRSITPPHVSKSASEDMTDSDSAHSGEVTEVRSWRGIDENGQPATFVEERKIVRMLEQGSERGEQAEFRSLNERLASRSWRDL
jgi:hypothetical protein